MNISGFLIGLFGGAVAFGIGTGMAIGMGSLFHLWRFVRERTVHVYVLFGKTLGAIDEPGLRFPIKQLGLRVLLVSFFGRVYVVDTRISQHYLRDQLVNSEEGAPMGVGIWYERFVTNPEAYLFKNSDPEGSLAANVATAVIKQLSNLKLDVLLEDRDALSRRVREEVSPTSEEWGFTLGSTYIRKVAFRDAGMIREIERKVVNRLRQVTASMRQEGENQVAIITSQAEREAAQKLGQAQAVRPRIVGEALSRVRENAEVGDVLFRLLDLQATLKSNGRIVLVDQADGTAMQFMLEN